MVYNSQYLLDKLFKRRSFFTQFFPKIEGSDYRNDIKNLSNTCPSCGYLTLSNRCSHDICGFCFWQDDGQDDLDAVVNWGGPNGDYSLITYRIEFLSFLEDIKGSIFKENELFNRIKTELDYLDNLIEQIENDKEKILVSILKIDHLFCEYRNIPFEDISIEYKFVK